MKKSRVKEHIRTNISLKAFQNCQTAWGIPFRPSSVGRTYFLSPRAKDYRFLESRSLNAKENAFVTKKREHWRQQNVNLAFSGLRDILPTHPPDKTLSKVDILKTTMKYIMLLDSLLKKVNGSGAGNRRFL